MEALGADAKVPRHTKFHFMTPKSTDPSYAPIPSRPGDRDDPADLRKLTWTYGPAESGPAASVVWRFHVGLFQGSRLRDKHGPLPFDESKIFTSLPSYDPK